MGHLLGVVTQPRLDEQRSVVKNEKRQGENRPYGRVAETVYRASFPPGHPYRTLPIGSMADLDAATLDDVREWFRTYYGAANAVLVLAGDIDVPTARAKPCPHPARQMDRRSHGQSSRDPVRRGRATPLAALLEYAARQYPRLRVPRPGGRNPRRRQDFAPV
jgi:hypothetical protein